MNGVGTNGVDQKVINIKPILFARLIFGYYHDFNESRGIRWIIKFYCASVFIVLAYCVYAVPGLINIYFSLINYTEYFGYLMISLRTNEKYIVDYFRYQTIVDRVPNSKRLFKKFWLAVIFVAAAMFASRIYFLIYFFLFFHISHHQDIFKVLMQNITLMGINLGRLSFILILGLLYCRVKLIQMTLEGKGFDNSPQYRLGPKKYTQMYEMVLDSLQNIYYWIKILAFFLISCSLPRSIIDMFVIIDNIKMEGTIGWQIAMLILEITTFNTPFLISGITLDLIADSVQKMKIITLDKRIASKNERERAEIQQFFQLLQNEPIKITLWRVVPLNLRALLTFISFCISTIIAILQMKSNINY